MTVPKKDRIPTAKLLLAAYLDANYSTLDIDEARHFVDKHTPSVGLSLDLEGKVPTLAEQIANKENLMEVINHDD